MVIPYDATTKGFGWFYLLCSAFLIFFCIFVVLTQFGKKVIGGADAKTPVGGAGFAKMADALALQNLTVTPLGEDFLLEGDLPCSPASSKK